MVVRHQGILWEGPEKNDYPPHLTFELRTPRPRGSASRILEGPGAPWLVPNSGQPATHEPINPLFQQLLQLPASMPPVKSRIVRHPGLCLAHFYYYPQHLKIELYRSPQLPETLEEWKTDLPKFSLKTRQEPPLPATLEN